MGKEIMTISINKKVADLLRHYAILLKQDGEKNKFRISSYYRAARTIEGLSINIDSVDPVSISGVGKSIAKKIGEILMAGDFCLRQELENAHEDIRDLLRIPGVGPATATKLASIMQNFDKEVTVENLSELVKFGAIEVSNNILNGLSVVDQLKDRIPYSIARSMADMVIRTIKNYVAVDNGKSMVKAAGSLRRKKDTIGDIDIIACPDGVGHKSRKLITDLFCSSGTVLMKGDKKISKVLGGIRIDLLFTTKNKWGASLLYFTGSKAFNQSQRSKAQSYGWTLNEHGLFDGDGNNIAGNTEESVFKALGMQYVRPEDRETK